MALNIKQQLLDEIIGHAEQDAPVEACGYLAGIDGHVKQVYRMTNADNSPEHYSFVPEEQFKAVKSFREEGLDLLGVYHSHPASPARMSQEDIRLAYDKNVSYVIVSLLEAKPVIKSFCFIGDRLQEEVISVVSSLPIHHPGGEGSAQKKGGKYE